MGIIFVVGHLIRDQRRHNNRMENISIISIPDSDTSAIAANETFSPRNPTTHPSLLPVTPKLEISDSTPNTINTTFTPEQPAVDGIQNDTFSPVKDNGAELMVKGTKPRRVSAKAITEVIQSPTTSKSRTPTQKGLAKSASTPKEFLSPPPNPVPEIIVFPPSTERTALRRSGRTPAKVDYAPPVTRRRSVRQTPLKTVTEEKKETTVTVTEERPKPVRDIAMPPPLAMPQQPRREVLPEQEAASSPIQMPPPSPVLLKSIRKRSLSVTDVDPPMPKRNFRVQFHSPGNMEKTITEIDESLYLNFSTRIAADSISVVSANRSLNEPTNKNQPIRRKRSLSNAETPLDKLATLQFFREKEAKATVATTTEAKKLPTPSPRKKMPNFAAIHQSIFQQMESLVDFNERKKERAQFLLKTTPGKVNGPTIAKPGRPGIYLADLTNFSSDFVFPVSRGAIGKMNITALKKPSANLLKPKNRTIGKRAATGTKLSEKKWGAILQTTDMSALLEKSTTTKEDVMPAVEKSAPVMPLATTTAENKKTLIKADAKENLASKPSKIKEPRTYDKDTKVKAKPVLVQEQNKIVVPVRPVSTVPPSSAAAKTEGTKSTGKAPLVKGVRVNRRFELMMKYRNKCTKK